MAHELRREDVSFVERAPLVRDRQVDLAAPPAVVWPAIADPERWPTWFTGMAACRPTGPGPHGVGSTRFVDVAGLQVDEEVLAFDEEERYAFTVLSASRPGLRAMVEVLTLAPTAAGTRLRYVQAVEPAGWMRPLLPLLRRRMADGLQAGLDGLQAWAAGQAPTADG